MKHRRRIKQTLSLLKNASPKKPYASVKKLKCSRKQSTSSWSFTKDSDHTQKHR